MKRTMKNVILSIMTVVALTVSVATQAKEQVYEMPAPNVPSTYEYKPDFKKGYGSDMSKMSGNAGVQSLKNMRIYDVDYADYQDNKNWLQRIEFFLRHAKRVSDDGKIEAVSFTPSTFRGGNQSSPAWHLPTAGFQSVNTVMDRQAFSANYTPDVMSYQGGGASYAVYTTSSEDVHSVGGGGNYGGGSAYSNNSSSYSGINNGAVSISFAYALPKYRSRSAVTEVGALAAADATEAIRKIAPQRVPRDEDEGGVNPDTPETPIGDGCWVLLLLVLGYTIVKLTGRSTTNLLPFKMHKMKHLLAAVCLVFPMATFAEGTETLSNLPNGLTSTTSTGSFTGTNGQTWSFKGETDHTAGSYRALTVDPSVSGNGLSGKLTDAQRDEGVGEVSFKVKGINTNGWGNCTFRITVGDKVVDQVVNVADKRDTYNCTATVNKTGANTLAITLVSCTGPTGTIEIGIFNISWTSYNGRTDSPTMIVDESNAEKVTTASVPTYYAADNIYLDLASTTPSATFYYTTDGTEPSTASASGTRVTLPVGKDYTVKAIAVTAALGTSDVATWTVKTAKGRIKANPCAALWPETTAELKTTYTTTKSGSPNYYLGKASSVITSCAYVCPVGYSFYATGSTLKDITVNYQTGTYVISSTDTTWIPSSEWTLLQTIASSQMVKSTMKRLEVTIPAALQSQVVRLQIPAGRYLYFDDLNAIEADKQQLAEPTFSQPAGEVTAGTQITLSAAAGATIYYSLDGTNYQTYSSAITINSTTSIFAYARKDGSVDSWTRKVTYTTAQQQTVPTPTITPNGGNINWGETVTLSCSDNLASIHYSLNGGTEINSGKATVTLTIKENTSVSAYATREGFTNSATAAASFTVVYPQLSKPTIVVPSGSSIPYGTQFTVLRTVDAGATIYYRFSQKEGYLTSKDSVVMTITDDCTIYAYADKEGCTKSESVSASYKVIKPKREAPTFSPDGKEALVAGEQITIQAQNGDSLYYSLNGGAFQLAFTQVKLPIYSKTTIRAFAAREGYLHSDTVSITYTIQKRTAPTFSWTEDSIPAGTVVTIANGYEKDTIYYRVNSAPWQWEIGEAQLTITENVSIDTYAAQDGYEPSEIVSKTYLVPTMDAPVFDKASGEYKDYVDVTITAKENAIIHYSIDGGITYLTSETNVQTLHLTESTNITAYATATGYARSENAVASYTVTPTPTDVDNLNDNHNYNDNDNHNHNVRKIILNGHIYIQRPDGVYDLNGRRAVVRY